LAPGRFILGTIHRDNNTDEPDRLNAIFEALNQIAEGGTTIFLPLHPRASKMLKKNLDKHLFEKLSLNSRLIISQPVSFMDIIQLEKHAQMIITDSGGVQKEAYFFKKPCIILRPQTEWVELVENGAAKIANADKSKILAAYEDFSSSGKLDYPPVFGDGNAAGYICEKMIFAFQNREAKK